MKICQEPCDECPFLGRFFMNGRQLRGIIQDVEERQSFFVCHKTSHSGNSVVFDEAAVCAGWLEITRNRGYIPQIIQIAERLHLIENIPAP